MVNYANSKIYQILCWTTGDCYIGSTVMSLNARLQAHKNRMSCNSKSIIERGNYTIELIEDYPCNTKEELLYRERFYFEHRECVNIICPIQSKEERKEQRKIYRDGHKEERKIYREKHKEEIKERGKKYKEKNREKTNLQQRLRYALKKENEGNL